MSACWCFHCPLKNGEPTVWSIRGFIAIKGLGAPLKTLLILYDGFENEAVEIQKVLNHFYFIKQPHTWQKPSCRVFGTQVLMFLALLHHQTVVFIHGGSEPHPSQYKSMAPDDQAPAGDSRDGWSLGGTESSSDGVQVVCFQREQVSNLFDMTVTQRGSLRIM